MGAGGGLGATRSPPQKHPSLIFMIRDKPPDVRERVWRSAQILEALSVVRIIEHQRQEVTQVLLQRSRCVRGENVIAVEPTGELVIADELPKFELLVLL